MSPSGPGARSTGTRSAANASSRTRTAIYERTTVCFEPYIARRVRLRFCGWLAAAALSGCHTAPVTPPANQPAVPLKLGLQTYTFRRYSFAETLDLARALGLRYVQAYPGQTLGG